jgi:hypothetical protein
MTKKITISVPDELHEKMEKWKESFNFSKVFQSAISVEIEKKEHFIMKLENDKSLEEILNDGNYETQEGQFQAGKEFGFAYAKTLRYHELKGYEKYIEGWNKKDREILDRINYDLDIMSIFDSMGLVREATNFKEVELEKKIYLSNAFDYGFITGIMEFIQEECSGVESSKVALERDKKMAIVKDKDERMKIFLDYKEKILNA